MSKSYEIMAALTPLRYLGSPFSSKIKAGREVDCIKAAKESAEYYDAHFGRRIEPEQFAEVCTDLKMFLNYAAQLSVQVGLSESPRSMVLRALKAQHFKFYVQVVRKGAPSFVDSGALTDYLPSETDYPEILSQMVDAMQVVINLLPTYLPMAIVDLEGLKTLGVTGLTQQERIDYIVNKPLYELYEAFDWKATKNGFYFWCSKLLDYNEYGARRAFLREAINFDFHLEEVKLASASPKKFPGGPIKWKAATDPAPADDFWNAGIGAQEEGPVHMADVPAANNIVLNPGEEF